LVQYRGNAATHDMELGARTLADLTSATGPVPVPRYDKSKFAGRGDRAAVEEWPVVEGPLDIVLFEGWMLGFRPQPASVIQSVDENLLLVNEALKAYKDAWDQWADCWLVIRVEDPQYVYKWRLQAEEQMRAGGKPGMTDEQIADFVSRFMPAYQVTPTPTLLCPRNKSAPRISHETQHAAHTFLDRLPWVVVGHGS